MSKDCTCPICRFVRNEITVSEIAWYLKGSIEHQQHYLNLIKNATSLDELKEQVKYDEYDKDCDYQLLEDLKSSETRNPNHWWDKAMDEPENYVLKRETKND